VQSVRFSATNVTLFGLSISKLLLTGISHCVILGLAGCRPTGSGPKSDANFAHSEETTVEAGPSARRGKKFPPSDVSQYVKFEKVAYFRRGKESELDAAKVHESDPAVRPKGQLFGWVLSGPSRRLEPNDATDLAGLLATPEDVTNQQARAWAGGVKAHLLAFDSAHKPLFAVDLQTTTPSEVVFQAVRGVNADLVRSWCDSEYEDFFYYEVTDSRLAAILFAIALELAQPPDR
jgi:hypothetical protein